MTGQHVATMLANDGKVNYILVSLFFGWRMFSILTLFQTVGILESPLLLCEQRRFGCMYITHATPSYVFMNVIWT